MQALADKPRAQRIEAEHIFPAAQFGNFRPCWRSPQDFPACAKSDGKTLSGRACCQAVDPLFEAAHNDLFNLVPAVGEVNGKRSDFNWGMIPGEKREFGTCNFEVDSSIRRVEPSETIQGDIARTMFYMADTYGFKLSRQDQQLYTAWSRQDPPDAWEIERDPHGSRRFRARATASWKTTPRCSARPRRRRRLPRQRFPRPPRPRRSAADIPSGWTCGTKSTCGQMASLRARPSST